MDSVNGNESLVGIIVAIVVALALAVIIVFVVRRRRYIRSLTDKGWQFVNTPGQEVLDGFSVPPFGLGFRRQPDEQVLGTSQGGVPFQVFDLKTEQGRVRLLALPLPFPLPEFVAAGSPRSGLRAADLGDFGGVHLWADNVAFAETLWPMIEGPVRAFGAGQAVELSIDGGNLVLLGAPTNAEELEAFVEAAAPIVQSLDGARLAPFQTPPPPPGFVFYRHPDWRYLGDDDTMLDRVRHSTGGHNHEAHDVVTGDRGGLTFIGLRHTWDTTRTETYTDSEGRTQTRTVTDHHSENILEGYLPFPLPYLAIGPDAIGPGWFRRGRIVDFEAQSFNDAFDVRAENPKFASDVVHPRQMEYLERVRPTPFAIDGTLVTFDVARHSHDEIDHATETFRGFLSRIPSFVWADLGVVPPQFEPTL